MPFGQDLFFDWLVIWVGELIAQFWKRIQISMRVIMCFSLSRGVAYPALRYGNHIRKSLTLHTSLGLAPMMDKPT